MAIVIDNRFIAGECGMNIHGASLTRAKDNGVLSQVQGHVSAKGGSVGLLVNFGPGFGRHAKAFASGGLLFVVERLLFVGDPNGERSKASSNSHTGNDNVIQGKKLLALDWKHDAATEHGEMEVLGYRVVVLDALDATRIS